MRVIPQYVVDILLDVLEGLRVLHDVGQSRLLAFVILAELGRATSMPHGIVGEAVANGLQVATPEGVERAPYPFDLLVDVELGAGFRHLRPPLSRYRLDPVKRPGWPLLIADYRLAAEGVKAPHIRGSGSGLRND